MASIHPAWGFQNGGTPHDGLKNLPKPPPWRLSSAQEQPTLPEGMTAAQLDAEKERGMPIVIGDDVARAVNAALLLRRPLLVTGKPGIGKSSIISRVAYELQMGPVLRWPINSRSMVKRGLYEYDAIARLQAQQTNESTALGDFLRLGPLGTAMYPTTWPRALLIDEIDKGDLDLPNDLLNVLEEGTFEIEELLRANELTVKVRVHDADRKVIITSGRVKSRQFPFIIMTSNGEREFPAPLLRRCIQVTIAQPNESQLGNIVDQHLGRLDKREEMKVKELIKTFLSGRAKRDLATDQLLNAAYVILRGGMTDQTDITELLYTGLTSEAGAPAAARAPAS